jgi:hypothetical protein
LLQLLLHCGSKYGSNARARKIPGLDGKYTQNLRFAINFRIHIRFSGTMTMMTTSLKSDPSGESRSSNLRGQSKANSPCVCPKLRSPCNSMTANWNNMDQTQICGKIVSFGRATQLVEGPHFWDMRTCGSRSTARQQAVHLQCSLSLTA